MRANLVQIGNSRGIRIPKAVLKQVGLEDEVEMDVRGNELVIRSARKPREGWAESCKEMAARGHDKLLDPVICTKIDESDWKW